MKNDQMFADNTVQILFKSSISQHGGWVGSIYIVYLCS